MKPRQANFSLGKLNKHDIAGLIELSASVNWDYDKDEIATVMSAGSIYGHKNEQGQIISSAAIIPYDENLASIGMVIVHKKYRGYGLGKQITQTCLDSQNHSNPVMLIATDEGKPLYEKLGFQTCSYVHKLICETYSPQKTENEENELEILPLTDIHWEQIKELDREAFGADRGEFLQYRIRQAQKGVVVKRKNGQILGYGLGVQGPVNRILGPIVAASPNIANSIVNSLAEEYRGKLRIDVPDGQNAFLQTLVNSGFTKVNQPPVMIKHSDQLPPRTDTLFAIAAQVFG